MAFIKAQKLVRNDSGAIISGSAAVVDSVYVKTGAKLHSRQEIRERLGRVLFLSDDKKLVFFNLRPEVSWNTTLLQTLSPKWTGMTRE